MKTALAKRIVLEWRTDTDSKIAKRYKWYCPVCDRVYERQTDAQLCCMERKEKPYWFKEDMEPIQIPVGVRHGGEFVPFTYSSTTVDNPDDTRYTTVSEDIVVFTGDKYKTHFIIPKVEQRDYVSSTASTFCYIDEAFEKWWATVKQNHGVEAERYHNLNWNSLIKWIDRYLELRIIPSHQTRCMIETRQQYKDFTAEDILHTLKTLGEKASHFYSAERDHFPGPLKKYYDYAIGHLVWDVATLSQDYEHFTDLVTRLTETIDPVS